MQNMYENLSKLETSIANYIEKAHSVKMASIINFLNDMSINMSAEFIQNIVRDLVNKEVLTMKQSPIDSDWVYELHYFYKSFKNIL
jgi:hypothetical protein